MTSPLSSFVQAINRWHARSLASDSLSQTAILRMADEAGLLLDLGTERTAAGVPSASGERCTRCRRKLQTVYRLAGQPYGRLCLRRAMKESPQ